MRHADLSEQRNTIGVGLQFNGTAVDCFGVVAVDCFGVVVVDSAVVVCLEVVFLGLEVVF